MRKPIQMTVREYFSRAEDIHAMMSKFPTDGGLNPVLVEAERLDIYEQHLPKRWQDNLYALGYDPMGSTLVELIEQAERQETIDALNPTKKSENVNQNPNKKSHSPAPKKGKYQSDKTHSNRQPDKKGNKYCLIHGQCAHDSNDCTLLKDQAGKMKATYNTQGNRFDKNRFKKAHEANQAESLKAALKGLMKSSAKKRKTVEIREPDEEVDALEEFIENNFEINDSGSDSDSA
jgi:hypothetical protein